MAILVNKIPGNLTEYPNSFKRQGAFPLEAYSVFYDTYKEEEGVTTLSKTALQAAEDYAANNGLSYVGQILVVVKTKESEGEGGVTTRVPDGVDTYVIENVEGDLKLLETNENFESLNQDLLDLTTTTETFIGTTFENYKKEASNNLTSLSNTIDDKFSTLRGGYEGTLSDLSKSIGEEIAKQTHFSVEIVYGVDTENNKVQVKETFEEGDGTAFKNAEQGVIYLLSKGEVAPDFYEEYMLVKTGSSKDEGSGEEISEYSLILTGTTSTDLSDYVTNSGLSNAFKKFSDDNLNTIIPLNNSLNEIEEEGYGKQYLISFTNDDNHNITTTGININDYVTNNKLENNYSNNDEIKHILNLNDSIEDTIKDLNKRFVIYFVEEGSGESKNIKTKIKEISLDEGELK